MSILSAIRHFVRVTLFISSTPPLRPEVQLSTCLVTVKDEDQGRVVYQIGDVHASKKVLPSVCITRAAVNESVCKNYQTDHV